MNVWNSREGPVDLKYVRHCQDWGEEEGTSSYA